MNKKLLRVGAYAALTLPSLAFAALGEHVSTVNSDQVAMHAAVHQSFTRSNYTVHEIVTPAGTHVREYAGTDGTVFAVAWEGPAMPDIRSLLGKHFDHYVERARNNRAGHAHAIVHDSDLVVHSGGRLRAFHGQAYLPPLLPAGVTPDQLQ